MLENQRTCPNSFVPDDWQEAQYGLLFRLDEFFAENEIEYAIDYGSLIGAIRHRGSIPWDNDIDITLHLDAYDKLVALAKAGKLPDGLKFISPETSDTYQASFGRIIDTRTSCALSKLGWTDDDIGLFVDVYKLIPMPDDPEKRLGAINDFLAYDEAICEIGRRCGNRSELYEERYAKIRRRQRLLGRKNALNWARERYESSMDPNGEWFLISSGGEYDGLPLRKREWVESTVRVPVRGKMIPVFKGYYEILRADYGDNWRYKPNNSPKFVPFAANLNVPGSFFLNEARLLYDNNKAVKQMKRLNRLKNADTPRRHRTIPDAFELKGISFLTRSRTLIAEAGWYADSLAAELAEGRNFELASKVANAFRYFYGKQCDSDTVYWRVAIPIEDNELIAALFALLLSRNDYWTAGKIVSITDRFSKRAKELAGNPLYAKVREACQEISDMHLEMDKSDVAAVRAHFERLVELCPCAYEARIGRIWLAANEEGAPSLDSFVDDLAYCGGNGEYLAYYADLLDKLGKADEAREVRLSALGKTSNQMVLLQIEDKLDDRPQPKSSASPAQKAELKDFQVTLRNLLSEIDEVCTRLDVQYCATEITAWEQNSSKTFVQATADATIAITREGFEKIRDELLAHENREIEEIAFGNRKVARYVASNTLCLNLPSRQKIEKPGLAVTMVLLEVSGGKVKYKFEFLTRKLPVSVLFPPKRGKYADIEINTLPSVDRFFNAFFKKFWKKLSSYPGHFKRNSIETVVDAKVPYSVFLASNDVQSILARKTAQSNRQSLLNKARITTLEGKSKRCLRARMLEARRLEAWQNLYPIEDELLAAAERDDREFLESKLKGYIEQVESFLKSKRGFYVDDTIAKVAKPLLVKKLGKKQYEKYESLIDPKLKGDLAQKMRATNVDHPLLRD